jgi:hypothetical protein
MLVTYACVSCVRIASLPQLDFFFQQLGSHVINDVTNPPAPSTGTTTLNSPFELCSQFRTLNVYPRISVGDVFGL